MTEDEIEKYKRLDIIKIGKKTYHLPTPTIFSLGFSPDTGKRWCRHGYGPLHEKDARKVYQVFKKLKSSNNKNWGIILDVKIEKMKKDIWSKFEKDLFGPLRDFGGEKWQVTVQYELQSPHKKSYRQRFSHLLFGR